MHRSSPSSPPGRAALAGTAAALGAAGTAVLLLVAAGARPLLAADRALARSAHAWALDRPGWTETCRVFSDLVWDPWTMRLLLAVAVVALWRSGRRSLAGRAAVAGLLCAALQQLLKAVVGRERPRWEYPLDSAHYAAMPSGHAMTAAFTCVLLVCLLRRGSLPGAVRWPTAAVLLLSVPGVCVTRVVLGVHWPTDTVAGALLGASLAVVAAAGDRPGTGAPGRGWGMPSCGPMARDRGTGKVS